MRKFDAQRVTQSCQMSLKAPAERVFPLLCPVREELWIPGWTYELVYSESGFNEEGCIFKTEVRPGVDSLWYCVKHDPQERIVEFLVYIEGFVIRKMEIKLTDREDGRCDARFTFTLTAVTEKGNHAVANYSESLHLKDVCRLVTMLNKYLESEAAIPAGTETRGG